MVKLAKYTLLLGNSEKIKENSRKRKKLQEQSEQFNENDISG